MKKLLQLSIVSFLLLVAICNVAVAQAQRVVFNYEESNFNNNAPLPVAENFVIVGPVSNEVSMVEVKIFSDKPKSTDDELYKGLWKRHNATSEGNFYLPVNFKLRSTDYDLVINYYRLLDENEIANIKNDLFAALDAYVEQTLLNKPKRKLFKETQESLDDLNSIVNSATVYNKNSQNIRFKGFSDIVRDKIKTIKSIRKNTAKKIYPDLKNDQALIKYRETQVNELKALVRNEASYLLNTGLSILADSRYINNYPVEKDKTILTVHGGYGGVYLGGGTDDLSYGSGFMAGLTFPLGRKAYASKFWSKSAIITGFYFNNFENENGVKVSGPIFKRPTYIGLGYRAFNFIRISAGAAFLENRDTAGGLDDLRTTVTIRPFVGIQADLNFWMDLAR